MNTTQNRRLRRWIPSALAAAVIALGAAGFIDPALAGAAPRVTPTPQGPGAQPAQPAQKPKQNPVGVRCTLTDGQGNFIFYLPGDREILDGVDIICGADGQWRNF